MAQLYASREKAKRHHPGVGMPANGGRAQEAALISKLYHEHRGELIGCATSYMRSPDLAEEAVQQVFANTVVTLRRGVEIRHPRRWLHRCLRNHCLNTLREMKKLKEESAVPIQEAYGVTDNETAPDMAELRERCAFVREAVGDLPPSMREVFLLAEVRGLGYQEIAELIGKTVGSVRYQLHAARKQIRHAVGHEDALLAGPLFWIGARGSGLAARRPTLRELLAVKLDALRAWPGSLGERVTQLSAKPALALVVGAVVAVPVVGTATHKPGAGFPEERSRAQQRRALPPRATAHLRLAGPTRARRAGGTDDPAGKAPGDRRTAKKGGEAPDRGSPSSAGRPSPAASKSASANGKNKDGQAATRPTTGSQPSPGYAPLGPGNGDDPGTDPGRESFDDPGPNPGRDSFGEPRPDPARGSVDEPGADPGISSLDQRRSSRETIRGAQGGGQAESGKRAAGAVSRPVLGRPSEAPAKLLPSPAKTGRPASP